MTGSRGRVLIIAGSDSGGGAGIQADIKAVTALGGFAMTAITALTAQNTTGVFGIHPVPEPFIAQQIGLVLDDLGADCLKTGMLHSAAAIETVTDALDRHAPDMPLVADPVMIAKGGAALLESEAVAALRRLLLPRATLITPNLPEAAALLGSGEPDVQGMEHAARALLDLGPSAVLLKGGHLAGDEVVDVLAQRGGKSGGGKSGPGNSGGVEIRRFASARIDTPHTHGTGCTLASAIAAGLAQGLDLEAAVARGRAYTIEAIRTAPGYGHGHGPLNHGHTVAPFTG